MSKPLVPLLTIFLALWLFGGAYWMTNIRTRNSNVAAQKVTDHILIQDGNFKIESPTIFAFQTSDADLIINEEQFQALDKLAVYLDGKKEKQLHLVAYYGKEERNRTSYKNLGIARAESIKNILTRRGAPENNIVTESIFLEKLILNENGLLSGGVEFEIFDKETSNRIIEEALLTGKVFFFEKGKHTFSKNAELEKYVADLKQFMVDNKNAEVLINSFYALEESKKMGVLRAEFIKSVFIEHEITEERIRIEKVLSVSDNSKEIDPKDWRKVEIKVQ